jgi:Zn-dependent M28 family amino/carboxypeptidase
MRRASTIALLVVLATLNDAMAEAPATSCIDDGKPYDTQALGARLAFLASKELDGRVPGSDGDRQARAHIAARFACLGLSPGGADGSYEQPFLAGKRSTANVIGFIAGTDAAVGDEIIVIGAHHDHLGKGRLGANDNASGVTALVAIAQWMKQQAAPARRTVAFVAFGAEEDGMIGSRHYAANAPAALPMDKVVQYINLDMVGSYRSKKYVAAMGTFAKLPATKLLRALDDRYPKLHVGMGGRARGSDHLAFCTRGIPYVFFWTPDARCYHASCDTAAAIDLPRMADIAALAGDLAWALADSKLDLAASREKLGCHGT